MKTILIAKRHTISQRNPRETYHALSLHKVDLWDYVRIRYGGHLAKALERLLGGEVIWLRDLDKGPEVNETGSTRLTDEQYYELYPDAKQKEKDRS